LAIKGKKKTRGGRPSTNAPRPMVVAPKRPFLSRRSTRWGAFGLILAIVGTIMLVAWRNQREDERVERQGIAIDEVNSRLTLAVQGVAQPGAGGELSLLPQFVVQVEGFRNGTVKPAQVTKDNKGVPAALDAAIAGVGEVDVPEGLRNTDYTVEVIDAKTLMLQGLRTYKVAVRLTLTAAGLEGKDRTAVLEQVSEQVQVATRLFDYGQQKLINIRVELGTFEPTDFNPGFPGS
jgi:hypothetical protein